MEEQIKDYLEDILKETEIEVIYVKKDYYAIKLIPKGKFKKCYSLMIPFTYDRNSTFFYNMDKLMKRIGRLIEECKK